MAKILLVEDDQMISRMIRLRLMVAGHQVDTACNGQLGVDMAVSDSYDLILMDMHMPVLDGHQAVKLLRGKGYEGLIVAVTASVMSQESNQAMESGCDDFICKPIGEDFEQRIEKLLE